MADAESPKNKLVIRSWPKLIFLWPTLLVSLALAILNQYVPTWDRVWGGVFLGILGINLTIITFDFPRTTSLTVLATIIAVGFGLVLINQQFHIIAPVAQWFAVRYVSASTEFYWFFFGILAVLFFGMMFTTRFDYWELSANELVHHTGLLGDIERFSTAGLKLNKEITDVFEYILTGSGTIILNIPGNPRPIVMHNVLRIAHVERRSDEILNARFVRVDSANVDRSGADRQDAAIRQESEDM